MGKLDDLCRFCTQKMDSSVRKNIFDAENSQLLTTAALCIPLPMSADDRYPKFSCTQCVIKLNIIREFQDDCFSAIKFFNGILSTEETTDPDDSQLLAVKEEESFDIEFIEDLKEEVEEAPSPEPVRTQSTADHVHLWACTYCNELFDSEASYIIHLRLHTDGKPFQCNECEMTFSFNSNLIHHVRKNHVKLRFRCRWCGNKYERKEHLTAHKCSEESKNSYPCEGCGKRFKTMSNLNKHTLRHMKTDPKLFRNTGQYPCTQCGRKFDTEALLHVHLQKHKKLIEVSKGFQNIL